MHERQVAGCWRPQGKEWWIPRIAGSVVWVGILAVALSWATTQEERSIAALLPMTWLLPFLTRELVEMILERLATNPSVSPNVEAQGRCAALSRSVPWSAVLAIDAPKMFFRCQSRNTKCSSVRESIFSPPVIPNAA